MTVATTTNRIDYTGNGSLDTYAYPFPIFEDSDLEVYLDGVLQTLTTDYTVTGAGDDNGGNVVFGTAPGSAVAIAILRNVSAVQDTDYVDNDSFPAETHEAALDRLTMLVQQLQERLDRAVLFDPSSTQSGKTLADLVGSKFLQVNADGDGIGMVSLAATDIASISQLTPVAVDYSATPEFDAEDGSLFDITLTGNVTSSTLVNAQNGQLLVFRIHQDGTGGRTFVWPTNVKGGMTIGPDADAVSSQMFYFDGTNAYPVGPGAWI